MNNKYKVLLIEDEANIRNLVSAMLETHGYQIITAETCASGVILFDSHVPDLVVLDLGLPDGDGNRFIRYVRKSSAVPIIVLSARSGEKDKIASLDLGANDYITKPFGAGEFMARVRSALRNFRHSSEEGRLPGGKFILGDLVIDYDARRVCVSGNEIHFTQTEYNIVALLSEHSGKIMTYSSMIKAIWGDHEDEGSIKKLQVNMANIRKKLGAKPGESRFITNELGVGYRMEG